MVVFSNQGRLPRLGGTVRARTQVKARKRLAGCDSVVVAAHLKLARQEVLVRLPLWLVVVVAAQAAGDLEVARAA